MKKRIMRWSFVFIVTVLFLTGVFPAHSLAKERIIIGQAASLSGPLAPSHGFVSAPYYDYWVKVVNASGGIYVKEYGKKLPVELLIYDDKSDIGTMTRLLEKLIMEEKVDFLLPPWGTAMHFAAEYPHRIKSLIVLDISPKDYAVSHDRIIDYLSEINTEEISSRNEADKQLSYWIDRKDTRQFLLKNLQPGEGGKFSWRINLPVIARFIEEISSNTLPEKQYHGPVLFIRGGNSNYILTDDLPRIIHYFPKGKIHTIEGASHWLHAEKPEEVYTAIFSFLKTVK